MNSNECCQTMEIKWNRPDLVCPFGLPLVLAEQSIIAPQGIGKVNFQEIESLYSNHKPPRGYSLFWFLSKKPPVSRSDEFRANIRVRKMKQRIIKNYPLFAEQFIEEELHQKSDYFSGKMTNDQVEAISDFTIEYQNQVQRAKRNLGLVVHVDWRLLNHVIV
ncbi:MAG: hypothetical protein PHC99_05360 [Methylococcales bacterium]|nr:hypothetical protein [Methylococcales bacterium]